MNDKQLEALIYVARHGTFKQAAEALYFDSSGDEFITPESMQYRIKQLEAEIGVSLYRKRQGSSRVLLTREGQLFLREALEVHQRMSEWRDMFLESQGGTLTFATTQAVLIHRICGVVKTFTERHPRVRLRMLATSAPEIESMIEQGRVDFGLSTRPPEQSDLEYVLWKRSRLVCVVPEAHPLAARAKVSMHEIVAYPLLLLEPEIRGDRELVDDTLRQLGIRNANIALEAGNSEILLSFVEAGLGVTIIAETSMLQQRRRLKSVEIADSMGKTEVGLLVRQGQYMPQRVQEFLRMLDPLFGRWLEERKTADPGVASDPELSNGKTERRPKVALQKS